MRTIKVTGKGKIKVNPMNRLMRACEPVPAACDNSSYDIDIEVSDTVTVVWEIG